MARGDQTSRDTQKREHVGRPVEYKAPREFRVEWRIYLGVALRAWKDRKEGDEERTPRGQMRPNSDPRPDLVVFMTCLPATGTWWAEWKVRD